MFVGYKKLKSLKNNDDHKYNHVYCVSVVGVAIQDSKHTQRAIEPPNTSFPLVSTKSSRIGSSLSVTVTVTVSLSQ